MSNEECRAMHAMGFFTGFDGFDAWSWSRSRDPHRPSIRFVKRKKEIPSSRVVGVEPDDVMLGEGLTLPDVNGTPETFREVVEGCTVPVVIAGGSKTTDEETLKMIEGAVKAGGAGISMGRNAFQHENPTKLVKAACAIVHEGISAEAALKIVASN